MFNDLADRGKNHFGGFEVCLNPVDYTCLAGLPLKELNLSGSPVKDLSALKGMRLDVLDISGTDVTDLTPLRGCLFSSDAL